MRVVYLGHNRRGITCLEALHSSPFEVVYAVGLEGESGWYSSILDTAKSLGIPCSAERQPNDETFLKKVRKLEPDLVVMCGYSKIVGKAFRQIPHHGCINLHASKLPFYRGAAPLNWALIKGEKEIGLSIYQVDGGIDTGPIIAQATFEVTPDMTIKEVLEKSLELYPPLLLEVCDQFAAGTITSHPQNLDEGSYFTKRYPRDGEFSWESSSDQEIYNLVRALTKPYPGAYFNYQGQRVYVWAASLEKRNYRGVPGRVATRQGGGVVVIAKNRGLRLEQVQVEEKPALPARDVFKRVGEDLV